MKGMPPPNLDKVVARYWAAGFPGRPPPPNREYHRSANHHVVLLGDGPVWRWMLRWGESDTPEAEAERLRYLLDHNPPVHILKPLATITTDLPPPFDRCEFQTPVNGRPLHEYLATHRDVATQQRIGVALGSLAAWLNRVPIDPAITPARDEHSRDVHVHRDEHLARLHRCGLDAEQSANLLQQLVDLWRTQPPLALCHDDLYPQHILVSDDGAIGVIDWGDIASNDPFKDFTFWYEPFDGVVWRELYPAAWQAACRAYRPGFPTPDEERRLILHALAGEFAYDQDSEAIHVADWLARYAHDFGLQGIPPRNAKSGN